MDERVVPGSTDVSNLRRHIARYNFALSFCESKKVLDVACGSGYGTDLISRIAFFATGVDNSNQAITIANKYYKGDDNRYLYYEESDANEYISQSLSPQFDTIVCFETLEHFNDEQLSFFTRYAPRILFPEGVIVYSVPLDETDGWNPHHRQIFDIHRARTVFRMDFVDEYVQVGINFYRVGEQMPEGKRFYIGVRKIS